MEFRPERFQGEEGKKIHKFAHIPFSAGSRVCVGNNFSLVEQKLFLVKLLQRFKIELTPGYKFKMEPAVSLHHMDKDFEVLLSVRQ
jgi:cytochrome P450